MRNPFHYITEVPILKCPCETIVLLKSRTLSIWLGSPVALCAPHQSCLPVKFGGAVGIWRSEGGRERRGEGEKEGERDYWAQIKAALLHTSWLFFDGQWEVTLHIPDCMTMTAKLPR